MTAIPDEVKEKLTEIISKMKLTLRDPVITPFPNPYGFHDFDGGGSYEIEEIIDFAAEGLHLIVENTKLPVRGSRQFQKTVKQCDDVLAASLTEIYHDHRNPVVAMVSYAKYIIDLYGTVGDPKKIPEALRYRRRFHEFLQGKKYTTTCLWTDSLDRDVLRSLFDSIPFNENFFAMHPRHRHTRFENIYPRRTLVIDEFNLLDTEIANLYPVTIHSRFHWFHWFHGNAYGFEDLDDAEDT